VRGVKKGWKLRNGTGEGMEKGREGGEGEEHRERSGYVLVTNPSLHSDDTHFKYTSSFLTIKSKYEH